MFYFTVEAAPDAVTHDPINDGEKCEGVKKELVVDLDSDFIFPSI